jgi:O-methyltransferase involved in polyketide biosynthesis
MTTTTTKLNCYWKRPFEGMNEMEKARWGMEGLQELMQVNEKDGMTFANKTAMWIAYERQLESERPNADDRLFCDPLAKCFAQPYGKQTSDVFACIGSQRVFDPNLETHVFEHEGYTAYHAARVKLISVELEKWLAGGDGGCAVPATNDENSKKIQQVINVGAGVDTRAFWDTSLRNASLYVEIDDVHVQNAKQTVLDDVLAKGELPAALCPRKVVSMNFANKDESIKDLVTMHDFTIDRSISSTCWLLEGLIMYLDQNDVDRLLEDISNLSSMTAGSISNESHDRHHRDVIFLNFANGGEDHQGAAYCQEFLTARGWKHDRTVFFGEPDFNFGRYPQGKPANETFGFSFYSR